MDIATRPELSATPSPSPMTRLLTVTSYSNFSKRKIPYISYKEFEKRLTCNVILRSCCSWTKFWNIEITETGDGMFFEKGWAEFFEDNSLINGEVVGFKYNGGGVYDFSISDSSYCEKIMVNGAQAELKGLKENDGDGAQAVIVNEVKK